MKSALISGIGLSVAAAVSLLADVHELPAWSVRLGWTLVHSSWQLTLIALVAFLVNVGLSRRSANTRYTASVFALVLMFVVPCWTWSLIPAPVPQPLRSPVLERPLTNVKAPQWPKVADPIKTYTSEVGVVPNPDQDAIAKAQPISPAVEPKNFAAIPVPAPVQPIPKAISEPGPSLQRSLFDRLRMAIIPWLGFIDTFWFVGVLLLSIRPAWGLWMQIRLRRTGLSNVPEELRLQLQQLAQRMGVTSAVRIAVSALVKVPMVVGYLRPMILLPASVLTGLTPTELESLLAHELAHIRRHDWIVNALQVVVETLLFYHPAVWWVSHCIRHERELCCDDLALDVIQDKAKYGRMLLALEELLHHSPATALAATGGNLVYRIRRLLPVARPPERSFNGWFAAFVMLVLTGIAGGLSILSAQPSPAEKPKPPAVEAKKGDVAFPAKDKTPKNEPTDENAPKKSNSTPIEETDDSQASMSAVLTISSHNREIREALIDIGHMTISESHWYADAYATRLYHDRWLRARGFGDMFRDDQGNWIAFRGALMLVLDMENLDEAAGLPLAELKSRFSAEGRVVIPEEEFKSRCLAIQTAEGQVAVGKFVRPFPWSVKLDLRRLTTNQQAHPEHSHDGVESAAWGPVVDGLQAGIVYRTREPKPKMSLMIGDMVMVKLFVRNASDQEKTYNWQLVDEFGGLVGYLDAEEISERRLPHLPMFDTWQPTLIDAAGTRAIISPMRDHRHFLHQSARLKPGEAVLVGTAATTLWSAIDVDFGTAQDWLNAVEVTPGEYRLSSDLESGLVNSPKLRTGELLLQVVQTDPERAKTSQQLDSLSCRRKNHSYGDEGWNEASGQPGQSDDAESDIPSPDDAPSDMPPRRSGRPSPFSVSESEPLKMRPLLRRSPDEYLILPGLVFDEATKKPVKGAEVAITIEANADGRSDDYCQYYCVTDTEGRFTARIPRKLLSGYADKYVGTVRATVNHPAYSKQFVIDDMNNLRTLGLIDKDGKILAQGKRPESAKSKKEASIQQIALRPARTISGRLMGPDNQPLANTEITAYERTWIGFPSVLSLERTDTEGRFRFNVPAKVTAQLEFKTRGLPDKEVTVTTTQTELGDLIAAEGQRIRGQVLDAAGKPVAYVTLTAPHEPRPSGEMVSVFKTDEKGHFESGLLQSGEYRLEVGEIKTPDEDRKRTFVSGPPPDLYIPYRFKVEQEVTLPEVTLSPAKSTIITATLITTITPSDDKGSDAFDVMLVKHALENSKTSISGSSTETEKPPKLTVTADPNTGKLSVKDDPDNQWALSLSFLYTLAESPYVVAQGTLDGKPWTAATNVPFLVGKENDPEDQDQPESKEDPHRLPLKIPRSIENLTLDSGFPIQHVQIGSGPKLFGKSFRVPNLNTDQLEVKIYHYKATTLRVRLVDANEKPVAMPENKLPEGLTIKARYVREDEVRQAGAVIEPPDETAGLAIWDNEFFNFVLPDEEIEIAVTIDGMKAERRFTLKDGETRTAELKVGSKMEWTETSKPTPKMEFEE